MTAPAGNEVPTHQAAGQIVVQCRDRGIAFTTWRKTHDPEAGHLLDLPTGDRLLREPRVSVPRAADVPCLDGEEDGPPDLAPDTHPLPPAPAAGGPPPSRRGP